MSEEKKSLKETIKEILEEVKEINKKTEKKVYRKERPSPFEGCDRGWNERDKFNRMW